MPMDNGSVTVSSKIQQLLAERQQLANAIAKIDQTLAKVDAALGGAPGMGMPVIKRAAPMSAAVATSGPKKRRGRRSRFSVTAEELVLTFVGGQSNPTTSDVNQYWKAEGRSGTADNTLTKLVKEKKLLREKLGGRRGSTYTVA